MKSTDIFNLDLKDIIHLVEEYMKKSQSIAKDLPNIPEKKYKIIYNFIKLDNKEYIYISNLLKFYNIIYLNNKQYLAKIVEILNILEEFIMEQNKNIDVYNKLIKVIEYLECLVIEKNYKNKNDKDEDDLILSYLKVIAKGYERSGNKTDTTNCHKLIKQSNNKLKERKLNNIINIKNSSSRKKYESEYYDLTKTIDFFVTLIVLKDKFSKCNGYGNYSKYINNETFLKNQDNIMKIIWYIMENIKEKYKLEYDDLFQLNNNKKINSWDLEYLLDEYKSQYLNSIGFNIDSYFQLNNILDNIIKLFSNLFDINITNKTNLNIWNNNILKYDVIKNNITIGELFLDLDNSINSTYIFPKCDEDSINIGVIIKSYLNDTQIFDIVDFIHTLSYTLKYIVNNNDKVEFSYDHNYILEHLMEYVFWYPKMMKLISSNKHGTKLNESQIEKIINYRDLTIGFEIIRDITLSFYDQIIYTQQFIDKFRNINGIDDCLLIFYNLFKKISEKISPDINFQNGILYPGIDYSEQFGNNGLYYCKLTNKILAAQIFSKIIENKKYNNLKEIIDKLINNSKDEISSFISGEINLDGFIKIHNIPKNDDVTESEYSNTYTEKK